MVDGERGDDGIVVFAPGFTKRRGNVIGNLEADIGVRCKALAGELDHRRGEIHEVNVRGGIPGAHEGREDACAGAEIEDARGACRDEVRGAAVERVIAGDELGAVGVVGGGGDVEDGLSGGHRRPSGFKDTVARAERVMGD